MDTYADVVLPIPLERLFTYRLKPEEADILQPGMRVAVPFGKSKIYTGLVHTLHHRKPTAYGAKELHTILDHTPTVNAVQLAHWQWMAAYYMCTLGEVFRAAVPGALLLESETFVVRNPEGEVDESQLKDDEFLIFEALQYQSGLRVQEVAEIVDRKRVLQLLNRMLEKGVIRIREVLQERYRPKTVPCIRLTQEYEGANALEPLLEELQRAPRQREALLAYFQLKAAGRRITLSALETESGVSRPVIRALVGRGVLDEYEVRTDRVVYDAEGTKAETMVLTPDQEKALRSIHDSFSAGKVCLLHGVTASGKTEVYVRLIEETLALGREVLYLLPEIALTTQLIERLRAYFGGQVTVYHSRYNLQERVEAWNNVLHGREKARVVLGARSALFLPFSNLGLVIVDEEHEHTYKQYDPAPRYHARDSAVVLAGHHGAHVLLGSATPSIESFSNVKKNKYGLARMDRRYGDVLMPVIELVDLKDQWRRKRMKGHFSEQLVEAIGTVLEAGEQVILFQNRRGFAPIVECQSCGHSPQCPNCDVSLTYHRHREELRCHYCGFHFGLPEQCPACGNVALDNKGFGTEQVEEEVQALFPGAATGRMDLDTTRGKHGFANIITAFEEEKTNVLVGTQMVTKGLDFRNVALVGIMNADSLLNYPDFRSHERCFQLLTQVAGRAGRTKKRGKVIIQTYNPYHQILKQVSTGGYEEMFAEQVYEREQFRYPPAVRIIRVSFRHREFNRVNDGSAWFGRAMRNVFREGVLGPEFPPVARIRNQYIKNILLKIPEGHSLAKTKNSIKRIERSFHAISQFRSVRLVYDVDHI